MRWLVLLLFVLSLAGCSQGDGPLAPDMSKVTGFAMTVNGQTPYEFLSASPVEVLKAIPDTERWDMSNYLTEEQLALLDPAKQDLLRPDADFSPWYERAVVEDAGLIDALPDTENYFVEGKKVSAFEFLNTSDPEEQKALSQALSANELEAIKVQLGNGELENLPEGVKALVSQEAE